MHKLIGAIISGNWEKNITNLGIFVVAEDSRMVKCKICKVEVPHVGKTTKSFITTNLVHHLKAKDVEDYTKYNKLKGLNKEKS